MCFLLKCNKIWTSLITDKLGASTFYLHFVLQFDIHYVIFILNNYRFELKIRFDCLSQEPGERKGVSTQPVGKKNGYNICLGSVSARGTVPDTTSRCVTFCCSDSKQPHKIFSQLSPNSSLIEARILAVKINHFVQFLLTAVFRRMKSEQIFNVTIFGKSACVREIKFFKQSSCVLPR